MCDLKFSFFIAKQGDERRLFIVPDTFIFVAQQGDMTNSVILRLPILISTPPHRYQGRGQQRRVFKSTATFNCPAIVIIKRDSIIQWPGFYAIDLNFIPILV